LFTHLSRLARRQYSNVSIGTMTLLSPIFGDTARELG
jgi:hypothetical protein